MTEKTDSAEAGQVASIAAAPTRATCWAFSPEGVRCQALAGHDSPHAVVREWTDDEVLTPAEAMDMAVRQTMAQMHELTAGLERPAPDPKDGQIAYAEAEYEREQALRARCVACGHSVREHPEGPCTGTTTDGDDCDCKQVIPE